MSNRNNSEEYIDNLVSDVHWLGHSSFRIEYKDLVIYIDPWQLQDQPKADLILVTHDHYDHCSPEDIQKIKDENTIIVTVKAASEKLNTDILIVRPGQKIEVKGVLIDAVPAYNINKFRSPGVPFHPKDAGYVGFIIKLDKRIIYHAGDSDSIPEMRSINTDVALLPVSGIYVMTSDEAAEAAVKINPSVAVPMHVGRGIGSKSDAANFKDISPCDVRILPIEE